MKTLFITGTDTGVGKTVVTALLALRFQQLGFTVGVCKPFATGCVRKNGELVSEDAEFLKQILDLKETLHEINPIALEPPLAPLMAARMEKFSTEYWESIAYLSIEKLQNKYDRVLVEGVGGIRVPIGQNGSQIWTIGDFARQLECPSVVVTRRTLGTINHTLLTIPYTPRPTALISCDTEPVSKDDLSAQTNMGFLKQTTKLPIWGEVPYLADRNAATLKKMAARMKIIL